MCSLLCFPQSDDAVARFLLNVFEEGRHVQVEANPEQVRLICDGRPVNIRLWPVNIQVFMNPGRLCYSRAGTRVPGTHITINFKIATLCKDL